MQPEERDAALLLDMLTAARRVVAFVEGKECADYLRDPMLQAAVERSIEIIGEAARGVSATFKAAHPAIPWHGIIAQRHVLAHDYGKIDPRRIWDIATIHAPALILRLEPLIPPIPEDKSLD